MTDTQKSIEKSTDLKNEQAYEISIPFEDNNDLAGSFNQSEPNCEELPSDSPQVCSPYLLIANLRTHLLISMEKNSWLQKRIEDLEEERDFLRCQLERLISCSKTLEGYAPSDQRPEPRRAKPPPQRASPPSPPPARAMATRSGQVPTRAQPSRARRQSRSGRGGQGSGSGKSVSGKGRGSATFYRIALL